MSSILRALMVFALTLSSSAQADVDEWEKKRLQESSAAEYSSYLEDQVRSRISFLAGYMPLKLSQIAATIRVSVIQDKTRLSVYSERRSDGEGGSDRTLYISFESEVTLLKIAAAESISRKLNDGDGWLAAYLAYVKNIPDGEPVVDPLRACGILSTEGDFHASRKQLENIQTETIKLAGAMFMFIIAHELGHLLGKEPVNSTIPHELAADRFALELLRKIEESSSEKQKSNMPLYIIGAPALFLQWIGSMKGGGHDLMSETHPFDHIRARNAALYIRSNLGSMNLSKDSKNALVKASNETLDITNKIEKIGIDTYIQRTKISPEASTLKALKKCAG